MLPFLGLKAKWSFTTVSKHLGLNNQYVQGICSYLKDGKQLMQVLAPPRIGGKMIQLNKKQVERMRILNPELAEEFLKRCHVFPDEQAYVLYMGLVNLGFYTKVQAFFEKET